MKTHECDSVELKIRAACADQMMRAGQLEIDPSEYLALIGVSLGQVHSLACEAFFWDQLPDETWDPDKLKAIRDELVHLAAATKGMIECLERGTWAPHGGPRDGR